MTDGGDRFVLGAEFGDDFQRIIIDAQQVGVDLTAGQNQHVEIIDLDLGNRKIAGDLVAPIICVPAGNVLTIRRGDFNIRPGFRERIPRHFQLRLLEAVGCHNQDFGIGDTGHGNILRSVRLIQVS